MLGGLVIIGCHFFFLISTLAIALFFRNPERQAPLDKNVLVSAADGVVMDISENSKAPVLVDADLTRISVFMSVFNVHVNRWPFSGRVKTISHKRGQFLDARNPNSSLLNESNSIILNTCAGEMEIVQIAGKIARRIVWWVRENDTAEKGERFGLIKFGSRVDIYLPKTFTICAKVGSKVTAGVTVLAKLTT
ncbi:MAG: phosphatidylserine decarboxylase [Pseudomonadota bacterium]